MGPKPLERTKMGLAKAPRADKNGSSLTPPRCCWGRRISVYEDQGTLIYKGSPHSMVPLKQGPQKGTNTHIHEQTRTLHLGNSIHLHSKAAGSWPSSHSTLAALMWRQFALRFRRPNQRFVMPEHGQNMAFSHHTGYFSIKCIIKDRLPGVAR